jgi:hypothetical protein
MVCGRCRLDFQWYQTRDGLFMPESTQTVVLAAPPGERRRRRDTKSGGGNDWLATRDRFVVGASYVDGERRRERRRRQRARRRQRQCEAIVQRLLRVARAEARLDASSTPARPPITDADLADALHDIAAEPSTTPSNVPIYMQTISI